MKYIFAYKTETNGLPDWRGRSDAENQPHIVKLSAIKLEVFPDRLTNPDLIDLLIKPDGWSIPQAAINSHGITAEAALETGVDESVAIHQFHELLSSCGDDVVRVTLNKQFHSRIVRIATKRFCDEQAVLRWSAKEDHFCINKIVKDLSGDENASLESAYRKIFKDDFSGCLGSAVAAARVFHAITKKGEKL